MTKKSRTKSPPPFPSTLSSAAKISQFNTNLSSSTDASSREYYATKGLELYSSLALATTIATVNTNIIINTTTAAITTDPIFNSNTTLAITSITILLSTLQTASNNSEWQAFTMILRCLRTVTTVVECEVIVGAIVEQSDVINVLVLILASSLYDDSCISLTLEILNNLTTMSNAAIDLSAPRASELSRILPGIIRNSQDLSITTRSNACALIQSLADNEVNLEYLMSTIVPLLYIIKDSLSFVYNPNYLDSVFSARADGDGDGDGEIDCLNSDLTNAITELNGNAIGCIFNFILIRNAHIKEVILSNEIEVENGNVNMNDVNTKMNVNTLKLLLDTAYSHISQIDESEYIWGGVSEIGKCSIACIYFLTEIDDKDVGSNGNGKRYLNTSTSSDVNVIEDVIKLISLLNDVIERRSRLNSSLAIDDDDDNVMTELLSARKYLGDCRINLDLNSVEKKGEDERESEGIRSLVLFEEAHNSDCTKVENDSEMSDIDFDIRRYYVNQDGEGEGEPSRSYLEDEFNESERITRREDTDETLLYTGEDYQMAAANEAEAIAQAEVEGKGREPKIKLRNEESLLYSHHHNNNNQQDITTTRTRSPRTPTGSAVKAVREIKYFYDLDESETQRFDAIESPRSAEYSSRYRSPSKLSSSSPSLLRLHSPSRLQAQAQAPKSTLNPNSNLNSNSLRLHSPSQSNSHSPSSRHQTHLPKLHITSPSNSNSIYTKSQSQSKNKKQLKNLTIPEISILLNNINLSKYVQTFASHEIDGETLSNITCKAELCEAPLGMWVGHAGKLFERVKGFVEFGGVEGELLVVYG